MAAPVYILTCFYNMLIGKDITSSKRLFATAVYARLEDAEAAGADFVRHGVAGMYPANDPRARASFLFSFCVTRTEVAHPLDAASSARCSHVWHENSDYRAGASKLWQQCARCGAFDT